jgi:hypothetical protein
MVEALKVFKRIEEPRKLHIGRVHEALQQALIIKCRNAYKARKNVAKSMLIWDDNQDFPQIA